ncbi:MAG: hypothetical protein ABW061_11660 [Polyangiaceae bacterium]
MNVQTNPAERTPLRHLTPVRRTEHNESSFTRVVEQQTAKIPSHFFLTASLLSMAASAFLELRGRTQGSRFIGSWAAPLLLMGVYNKLVKSLGSY